MLKKSIEKEKKRLDLHERFVKGEEVTLNEVLEYQTLYYSAESYSFFALYHLQRSELNDAVNILKEGIVNFPTHSALHYNLGYFYSLQGDILSALNSYYDALYYEKSDDVIKDIQVQIMELRKSLKNRELRAKVEQMKSKLSSLDCRAYPLDPQGESLIRKPLARSMVNMYGSLEYENVNGNSYRDHKTERVSGEVVRDEYTLEVKQPIILPLSKQTNQPTTIQIESNGETLTFSPEQLPYNQFHYLRIEESGLIKVKVTHPVFFGDPIPLNSTSSKPRLVVKIFIDGLSQQFLEDEGLEKLMPYTYQFFEQGATMTNAYATSEWTLPSKMTINTGVYSTEHQVLHPEYLIENRKYRMLAEYFEENGYYCTAFVPNWRTTPLIGYGRGYNRFIYQNFMGGFDSRQIVMEVLEQLESLRNTSQFINISLMDLHHVADQIENHLYPQFATRLEDRIYEKKKGKTTVQTKFDRSKVEKYRQEIKRVDFILNVLYRYLEETFDEEEYLVVLHSDHGQTFLDETSDLLSDERLKIPLMFRGANVPKIVNSTLVEAVDILPTLLSLVGINHSEKLSGQVIDLTNSHSKGYSVSQILHPDQTYKAIVRWAEGSYRIESEGAVDSNLTFQMGKCQEKVHGIVDQEASQEIIYQLSKRYWKD